MPNDEPRNFEIKAVEVDQGRRTNRTLFVVEHPNTAVLHLIGSMTDDVQDFGRPGDSRNPVRLMPCGQAYDSSLETGMLPLFKPHREALKRALDYFWDKEQEDFRENREETHIFRDIVMLHNLLTGSKLTPEEHLEPLEL